MRTFITVVVVLTTILVTSTGTVLRKKKQTNGCIYKGNTYQQGQTWNDGCDTTCSCNDAARGAYRCTSNCPTYQSLPSACQLVKKPGECCAKPDCNFQGISGGSFTGSGTGTGMSSSSGSGSGSSHISQACTTDKIPTCNQYARTVCSRQEYRQWAAENCCIYCGISYTYTGTDQNLVDANGHYSGSSQGGSVSCSDSIPNCVNYTQAICHDVKYSEWVLSNCPAFCGLCSGGSMTGGTGSMTGGTGSMTGGTGTMTGGTGTMTGGTGTMTGGTGSMTGGAILPGGSYSVVCQDKVNCANYGKTTCGSAQYAQWVRENCPVYCGICGSMTGGGSQPGGSMTGGTITGTQPGGTMTGTQPGGTMTGTQPGGTMTGTQPGGTMTGGTGGTMTGGQPMTCMDTISNCKDYAADICSTASYHDWAIQNCAGHCNFCAGSGTMPGGTGTMTGGTGTMPGGTGTMTGGTGTMPGGTGTMTGGTGTVPGGTGTMTGGTGTMPGGTGTMTGGTGTMTGGPGTMTGGSCSDAIANCASYEKSTCTDPKFASWAKANCAKHCNMCSSGTGGMTGGMTGGSTGGMTGGMTGGTMTGSSCHDAISNCAVLDQSQHICTDAGAKVFATQNCPLTCNLCSSISGGTMTGGTGGSMTGGTGGSMTGGTGGSMTGGTGGSMTGGTGGSMTGGTCTDTLDNCNSYGSAVCSKPEYSQWVKSNCAGFCHLCGSSTGGTGTMTGGTGTMTGSTGGSSGGSSFNNPFGTHGGFISQGNTMSGQSSGCTHNGQVYQQGQSWRDGCKFQCTCVNASQGQYQCTSLCATWNLAPQCHLEQPAAGKCCPTPSCPAGIQINYPPNYVAN